MKKTAILLILVMMISLIPALNISAADDAYYLKGLYDGAVVVVQEEPTKTVTLVDPAMANEAATTITDVFKVVYTHNDNDPVEVYGSSLSYTMTFTHCGTQTLKYDVYKKSGDGVTPDISKTITFNVVAGTKNLASFTEDFESVSEADLAATIIANNGQNYNSSRLPLTTTDHNGSKALMLDAVNKNTAFQLRGAPSATGSKVHYYEFDMATNYSYSHIFYLRNASDYSDSTNQVVLFNSHKNTNLYSGTRLFPDVNTVRRVRVVLDYNETPTATVYFGGVEWKRISLADTLNTYSDIAIVPQVNVNGAPIYIDNFSYSVYDVKEPSSFSGASIVGGDKPVLETLPEIRFTGTDYKAGQSLLGKVALSERTNNSDGDFTESDISFTPSVDGTDVVVSFNEVLSLGMTYKVSISGVQDSFLNYYNDYEFIFRTLNKGENPLPEISLTSPVADERYYPNEDTITLSAEAYDTLGGSIAKVEFYVDGVLIGEGTNTIGNEYKFAWVLDDSIDKSEPVAITAKALDNEGGFSETLPVNIVIWGKQKPEITITAPEEGTIYSYSIGGVATGVEPKIEFGAIDYDGTIVAVNVYIDGNTGIPLDNPASAVSYTLPEDLSVGEHRVTIEVIDNDNQIAYDNVSIKIVAQGKSGYLLNENYKATDLRSKWHVTGTDSVSYDVQKGIIIAGENSAVTAERPIEDNLTETSFAVDIKTAFNNTSAKRVFKLGNTELVTFEANGTITYSGSQVDGLTYLTGQTYNVSSVIDAKTDKVYALVDGIKVGEASATYTFDPTVIISQEGEGEIAIVSVNASLLAEAKVPAVTFISEKKFTVDFPAGTDVTTLEGNVSMLDSTGKAVNLSYADGVFTVCEVLKPTDTYEIVILPDARDINGNGYSGIYRVEYIQPESSAVVAEVSNSGVWTEETSTYDGTLSVAFGGAYESSTEMYLICAAYKGAKMVDIFAQAITPLSTPQSYSLSNVDAETVIEAFVVDNFDDLNSISNEILKIK